MSRNEREKNLESFLLRRSLKRLKLPILISIFSMILKLTTPLFIVILLEGIIKISKLEEDKEV